MATYMISVAPVGAFAQTVALACAGAPAKSTCTVSPGPPFWNGAAQTVGAPITTTAASGLFRPTARHQTLNQIPDHASCAIGSNGGDDRLVFATRGSGTDGYQLHWASCCAPTDGRMQEFRRRFCGGTTGTCLNGTSKSWQSHPFHNPNAHNQPNSHRSDAGGQSTVRNPASIAAIVVIKL
jgi:hypothetical protein